MSWTKCSNFLCLLRKRRSGADRAKRAAVFDATALAHLTKLEAKLR